MHKLERVTDLHEEAPFYICRLTNAKLIHTPKAPRLIVVFERDQLLDPRPLDENNHSLNPWIIELTKGANRNAEFVQEAFAGFQKGRDVILANETHPARWVGSGALLIVADKSGRYAVINKRVGSFIWKDRFDANGGLASSIEDMLKPKKLGLRELSEEIKITAKSGVRIKPKLKEVRLKQPFDIEVHFKGQVFDSGGFILVPDAKTGTIDLRSVYTTEVSDVTKMVFNDTETIVSKEGKNLPTSRPILVFKLDDLLRMNKEDSAFLPVAGFINGKKIKSGDLDDYKISRDLMTPTLTAILDAL